MTDTRRDVAASEPTTELREPDYGGSVPWDHMNVTVEALPECIAAIRAEPVERHRRLLDQLLSDHQWRVATGQGDRRPTLNIMAVLLSRQDGERAASPEETLAAEILAELRRARAKFPGDNVTTLALVEEVGELAKATFEEGRKRVRKEAVQVATMAMRVVLDGDATLDGWRASRGLDRLGRDLTPDDYDEAGRQMLGGLDIDPRGAPPAPEAPEGEALREAHREGWYTGFDEGLSAGHPLGKRVDKKAQEAEDWRYSDAREALAAGVTAIYRQPPGEEGICDLCGTDYPCWSADSDMWNAAIRLPDGTDRWQFLCPTCFMAKAEEAGVETLFRVTRYDREPDAGEAERERMDLTDFLDHREPLKAQGRVEGVLRHGGPPMTMGESGEAEGGMPEPSEEALSALADIWSWFERSDEVDDPTPDPGSIAQRVCDVMEPLKQIVNIDAVLLLATREPDASGEGP